MREDDRLSMSNRTASENRQESAVPCAREESVTGERIELASASTVSLWDQVLERSNLQRAVKQVRQNKGAPGIDGMSVDALPDFLRQNWPAIRDQLEAGQYRPPPVRRVRIPKADGRERLLGISTVLDRFIQQAVAQVVSAQWDPHFHPRSYGFRPGKSAHQAVKRLQADIRAGGQWTVDLDLAAFFSAVDRPWYRQFLGLTVTRGDHRLKVSPKALDRLKTRLRVLTRRTRGHRLADVVADLRDYLLGWKAYFGIAEVPSPLREIDKWLRRRLRCYLWKQWGRSGYRQLRRRGVSVRDAWQTPKSAHGPWRLSHTPALYRALPAKYFADLGLPSLVAR